MKNKTYVTATIILMSCATVEAKNDLGSKDISFKPALDLTVGSFYSDKKYNNPDANGSASWQEAYVKYGFETAYKFKNSEMYGSVMGLGSGTFGEGDAGGFSIGKERKNSLEQWITGWRNASTDKVSVDLSIGRQNIQIADGFIVAGDALNMGKGIAEGTLNRGGAYYLAARRSFDFTTQLKLDFKDRLKTQWLYLDSDNQAQYQPKLLATDWQYQLKNTRLGISYLKIFDLNDPTTDSVREDLKDISIRTAHHFGDELNINAEYVIQNQKENNEKAGYVGFNYHLISTPYQPILGYRYSYFSEGYDPLFYGNTDAGFGTWFQGEVAGNYAGAFSHNVEIHQASLQATLHEKVNVGLLGYQFKTIDKSSENLDGHEVDLYALWMPSKHINIIPLVGWYKPKKNIQNGGTQVADTAANGYAQLLMQYLY